MPVPFMSSELLKLPSASVSPQTMAQIIGSVVITRKMPRSGKEGSFSKTKSVACTSENGKTKDPAPSSEPQAAATIVRATSNPAILRIPSSRPSWLSDDMAGPVSPDRRDVTAGPTP